MGRFGPGHAEGHCFPPSEHRKSLPFLNSSPTHCSSAHAVQRVLSASRTRRSHSAYPALPHFSRPQKSPSAEAGALARVQLFVSLVTLIETDVVEVAAGEFITLSMKAAAQMGTDLLSKCLALMCLVIFC